MSCPPAHVDHVHATPPVSPAAVLLVRRRLMVALGGLLVAFAIAAALREGQILLTWDEPIQRGVESRRTSGLDDFFLTVSRLGSTIPVLTLGTLAAAVTWRRCRAVGTVLLVATFARPLIEFTIKALVDRDRPDFERLVAGNGPSFPSGHVMAAIALWGLLPVVVSLYTRRRAIWWASVGVSVLLVTSISASRVYLGVHWFSDVTAGLVVGAFFLLGTDVLLRRQHLRHPCRLLPPPGSAPGADDALVPPPVEAVDPVGPIDPAVPLDGEPAAAVGSPSSPEALVRRN
jgi:undecaprenyl-diphosphatase